MLIAQWIEPRFLGPTLDWCTSTLGSLMFEQDSSISSAFQKLNTLHFPLYKGLLLSIPYTPQSEIATLKIRFQKICEEGLKAKKKPQQIVESFLADISQTLSPHEMKRLFLALAELIAKEHRLFSILEQKACEAAHEVNGPGSWQDFTNHIQDQNLNEKIPKILQLFSLQLSLPPFFFCKNSDPIFRADFDAFYKEKNLAKIQQLLWEWELAPLDTTNLNSVKDWLPATVRTVFQAVYPILSDMQYAISTKFLTEFQDNITVSPQVQVNYRVNYSAWSTEELKIISSTLRTETLCLYRTSIKQFNSHFLSGEAKGLAEKIEARILDTLKEKKDSDPTKKVDPYESSAELLKDLLDLRKQLATQKIFNQIESLNQHICTVRALGFYGMGIELQLDVQAISRTIELGMDWWLKEKIPGFEHLSNPQPYRQRASQEKERVLDYLLKNPFPQSIRMHTSRNSPEALKLFEVLCTFQKVGGEKNKAVPKYLLLQQARSSFHFLEVLVLFRWSNESKKSPEFDLLPVIETYEDLQNLQQLMEDLLENTFYLKHLKGRNERQGIAFNLAALIQSMGGFSALWEVFKAQQRLIRLSERTGIQVFFIDGHLGFMHASGREVQQFRRIEKKSVTQLECHLELPKSTLQTLIFSPTLLKDLFENYLFAGLAHYLFPPFFNQLSEESMHLMNEFSTLAREKYEQDAQKFLEASTWSDAFLYPSHVEVYFSKSDYYDLRMKLFRTPFWGFFGLGTALKALIQTGKENELKILFTQESFFKWSLKRAFRISSEVDLDYWNCLNEPRLSDKKDFETLKQEGELFQSILKKWDKDILSPADAVLMESERLKRNNEFPLWILLHEWDRIFSVDPSTSFQERELFDKRIKYLALEILLS